MELLGDFKSDLQALRCGTEARKRKLAGPEAKVSHL